MYLTPKCDRNSCKSKNGHYQKGHIELHTRQLKESRLQPRCNISRHHINPKSDCWGRSAGVLQPRTKRPDHFPVRKLHIAAYGSKLIGAPQVHSELVQALFLLQIPITVMINEFVHLIVLDRNDRLNTCMTQFPFLVLWHKVRNI